jgi:hypothetical protein
MNYAIQPPQSAAKWVPNSFTVDGDYIATDFVETGMLRRAKLIAYVATFSSG